MLLLLALLVQDGQTYRNPDYRVAFRVPGECELKSYRAPQKGAWWNWTDTLAEIRAREGGRLLLSGRLVVYESGMEPGPYAKWREEQWGKTCKDVKRISERAEGPWLRVDFSFEWESTVYRYVHLIGRDGRRNLELMLWCSVRVWDECRSAVDRLVGSAEYGELRPEAKPEKPRVEGSAVRVPEDFFAGCAAGTSVTYRLSSAGGESRVTVVLLWRDEKSHVLRTDVDGAAGKPVEYVIDGGAGPSGVEETIEVPAGKFKCRRIEGRGSTRWLCRDVPGGTVKLVADAGGAKSAMILISIDRR